MKKFITILTIFIVCSACLFAGSIAGYWESTQVDENGTESYTTIHFCEDGTFQLRCVADFTGAYIKGNYEVIENQMTLSNMKVALSLFGLPCTDEDYTESPTPKAIYPITFLTDGGVVLDELGTFYRMTV